MQIRSLPGRLLCLVPFLGLAATASAQVVFTLTATANDNNLGYVMGNTYTFVITTGSSFGNTGTSIFNSTRNMWSEEVTTDDQLWASIGGTGLSGSYARPGVDAADPSSTVKVDSPNDFIIGAGNNAFLGNIGLQTPDSSTIGGFEFTIVVDAVTFAFPSVYTQPNTYFAGYNGTYTPATPGWGRVALPVIASGSQAEFTFTSLTISGGAAVPEPATCAAFLGLGVFGLTALRRRWAA